MPAMHNSYPRTTIPTPKIVEYITHQVKSMPDAHRGHGWLGVKLSIPQANETESVDIHFNHKAKRPEVNLVKENVLVTPANTNTTLPLFSIILRRTNYGWIEGEEYKTSSQGYHALGEVFGVQTESYDATSPFPLEYNYRTSFNSQRVNDITKNINDNAGNILSNINEQVPSNINSTSQLPDVTAGS